MLECLSDYTALIQLLVGSVFISNVFFSRHDPYENDRKKLCIAFTEKLQGEDIGCYEIVPGYIWKKLLESLVVSVMVVLSVYGCVVLFYCANIKDCSEEFSNWVILVLSLVVTVYQVYSVIAYGNYSCLVKKIFYWGSLVISVLSFVFYMIYPHEIFIADSYNSEINAWVLVNFLLWVGLYIKSFIVYNKSKYVTSRLFADMDYYSQSDAKNRIEFAFNTIQKQDKSIVAYFIKKDLIRKIKNDINKDELYYTINIDVNNNNNFILLDQENISKINDGLREMIDKSTLSSCNKRRLKQILSKKDKIKSINISIFHDIQSERQEVLNKCLIKLEKLGILYKKHDGIV